MKFFSSEKLNNIDSLNFNPGPGHYDMLTRHVKPKPTPTATVSTRGQKKHAPSSAFGMGSMRFPEAKKENIDTGPGFYFGQNEWNVKKNKREQKAQFYPNPRKIITIPSIPSSTHAMGYVEREDGYLIPLNGSAVKDEQDLGPGSYHASDLIYRKKALGFSLAKTKSPRFPIDKSINMSGAPNAEQTEPAKRDLIANEFAKEREEKKSKPPKPKPEVIKEEEPGLDPGHYYNERNASSFNVQHKHPQFQYFGSTAKRFTNGDMNKISPGPGAYNDPTSNKSQPAPYLLQRVEPFSKGETRFRGATALEAIPGPGQYEAPASVTSHEATANAGGLQSAFGSGLTRFGVQRPNSETPGPGSYNPGKQKRSRKNKNQRKIPSVHSHNELRLSETPKEPSWGAEFDFGGRSKGAVIVKHEAPSNKGTSTFQSAAKRFEESKNSRSLTPGPGAYSFSNNSELVKKSFSTMRTNFALNPRDKVEGRNDGYKDLLGPGLYDYEVDIVKPNTNFAVKINPKSPFAGVALPK